MRQQRQKSRTKKRLANGHIVTKIGRACWQVRISGQVITGTLSYCASAAFQADTGHCTEADL